MSAFLLICNPVDVWDFRAFFASVPQHGYWCVTGTNFKSAKPGDRLFLRITSKDKEPGIHGRFLLKSLYQGVVPSDHWRPGKWPADPKPQFLFDLAVPALLRTRISASILKYHFGPASRLVQTPQSLSTEIPEAEADALDRLIPSP